MHADDIRHGTIYLADPGDRRVVVVHGRAG